VHQIPEGACLIGRTIGNYVVQREIGQGGMGVVYLAEHPRIRRQVAIKVLLPQYSKNAQVVGRFFNEAKAANEIRNEHIIDIIDFGELDDGASYITMEWLDGQSLGDLLDEVQKLPIDRAIHITRGIANALTAAHAHGIIHRDLKPDNIFLVTRNGDPFFVKVLDFGIAKLLGGEIATEVKTQTGAIIGTPAYMAPEQCRGINVDQRSDIYSLGIIMYRMLAGKLPFAGEALGELLLQQMTQTPTSLRAIDPTIPPAVDAAVLRALEKEPANRFQTVHELIAALTAIQTGTHTAIPDPAVARLAATAEMGKVDGKRARAPSQDTLGAAAGQAVAPTGTGPQPKSRAPLYIAGAAALLAGFGITAWVVTRPAPPDPKPAVVEHPTPPPKPPVPKPEVPAPPPAPTTARLTIRTIPPTAVLTLDDQKIDNPFEGSFAKSDVRHTLVVKAPGYKSESQLVTFDGDHAIEVALERGKDPKPGTGKPGPQVKVDPPKPPDPQKPPEVVKGDPPKPDPGKGKVIYKGTKGTLITDFPE
jgi:serine/threonine-protein kinase